MYSATISSKYQVVIPRAVREQLGLKPGQKVVFVPLGQTLRLIIVPPIEQAQGMFAGIDADVHREEQDEER
jgi:AbrB family looped-hinge helix DNA binding protein